MSRVVFKLSDIGEGITEAEITAWHVGIGDSVREDQPLVDVMTDKATVELTSPVTEASGHSPARRYWARNGESRLGPARIRDRDLWLGVSQAVPASKPMPSSEATPAAKLEATSQTSLNPRTRQNSAMPFSQSARQSGAPLASPATRHRAKELGHRPRVTRSKGQWP